MKECLYLFKQGVAGEVSAISLTQGNHVLQVIRIFGVGVTRGGTGRRGEWRESSELR